MAIARVFLLLAIAWFGWIQAPRSAAALESIVIAYPTTSSQFTPLWFAR